MVWLRCIIEEQEFLESANIAVKILKFKEEQKDVFAQKNVILFNEQYQEPFAKFVGRDLRYSQGELIAAVLVNAVMNGSAGRILGFVRFVAKNSLNMQAGLRNVVLGNVVTNITKKEKFENVYSVANLSKWFFLLQKNIVRSSVGPEHIHLGP